MRYVAASAIMTRFGGEFPLGTFVINVTGSFLIGFLMTILTERFKLDPKLAAVAGGGISGRVHDVFQLRMGDLHGGPGRAGSGPGCSTSFRALCLGT